MELDKLIEKFKNEQLEQPTEYVEPSENRFDAPIPGQSLTDEPGNYPWEHPPQRATIEEALDEIYESLMEEQNMKRMFTLLRMGIPVEALVKVITFSGFLEGKYTVDVAKLLEPIVSMIITGEAALAEIPAKINLDDGRPLETSAVNAAQGPGIQIVFKLFLFVSLTSSSPGSQIPGRPASLTRAMELPSLR